MRILIIMITLQPGALLKVIAPPHSLRITPRARRPRGRRTLDRRQNTTACLHLSGTKEAEGRAQQAEGRDSRGAACSAAPRGGGQHLANPRSAPGLQLRADRRGASFPDPAIETRLREMGPFSSGTLKLAISKTFHTVCRNLWESSYTCRRCLLVSSASSAFLRVQYSCYLCRYPRRSWLQGRPWKRGCRRLRAPGSPILAIQ